MRRTAASLLVDCLVEQGCERIFTVPGESFLPVLDALRDRREIALITCRHEGGAAFMACADGAMTRRPGVAIVTRGPGATNASIGVHLALQDSQPMLLLVGDVARSARDREGFQEVDFPAMFAPLAKWAARVDDAARLPEYIARAYAVAIGGRPGPVVLALPEDMLRESGPAAMPRPFVHRPAQAPCPDAMTAMMAMIADAASPIAIVGGAAWGPKARHYFTAFAERLGLPVATAFRRQDAVPPDSPCYAGNLGYGPSPSLANRVREADLLLVVGARLGEATTDGYSLITSDHPGQLLIHVHPDPSELNRVLRADLPICADPDEFAESAEYWDLGEVIPFDCGARAHRDWLEWSTPRDSGQALDLAGCLSLAREILPQDAIICNGAGNFSGWWHRYWRYSGEPSQLAPTAGTMGYGLPAAIAAALRHPGRCVVAVAGDGDFLMSAAELATAMQAKCNLIAIVFDNGSYGTIRMHQERAYPGRVAATDLVNPDFAALARSFGADAWRVESTAAFGSALREAMAKSGVRLIHCLTGLEQLTASGIALDSFQPEG